MKLVVALLAGSLALITPPKTRAVERLGVVSFPVSCATSQQANFNRGVALVHDFWYDEAERQFEEIAKADAGCAMAHWGKAIGLYHEIWNRPDEATLTRGWEELQKAQSRPAKTQRERDYIAALSAFYQPGERSYQARVDAYSAAMASLHDRYPEDVDAAAFYGLSLLADTAPGDTSLSPARHALTLLSPLFVKYPDHPGLAHYIIHACDTPALASQGLAAARRYSVIAPSGAHAAHMPAHIFARLGMWPEDIEANLASVAASRKNVEAKHGDGADQLHADDFLLYAYLQSGQDAQAQATLASSSALLKHLTAMAGMSHGGMDEMFSGYSTKLPVFYALERRDWKSAATLETVPGAPPEVQTLTYWARSIGNGHLRNGPAARADQAKYESLNAQIKQGKHAYYAEGVGPQIEYGIVSAWAAYAEGASDKALRLIRQAADLQDKVGQGEVDIPAREMLGDMLLELKRPQEALVEYERALELSPKRFNGLYNAGMAAQATGDMAQARQYLETLLKVTDNGANSQRPEFVRVKAMVASSAAGSY